MGKVDDAEEETGTCTPWDRRGMGSGNRRKILRNNVGIAFGKAWRRGN
jgi:hypothetical protein